MYYLKFPETRQIHCFYDLDEDISDYLDDGWILITESEFQSLQAEGWE